MRKQFWQTERGQWELHELTERFSSLRFELRPDEKSALVSGVLNVESDIGYTVKLEVPENYPRGIPLLYCEASEIPWELDRHVIASTGVGCLCVRSEYRLHWPEGSGLSDFIERLVRPFFVGQFYYETHGCWPSTGERSHGYTGIVEAYVDLCAPLGDTSLETVSRVMRLLTRKNDPQGHEMCPCGSGRSLRRCHRDVVAKLRRHVRPQDAATDHAHLLHFKVVS